MRYSFIDYIKNAITIIKVVGVLMVTSEELMARFSDLTYKFEPNMPEKQKDCILIMLCI